VEGICENRKCKAYMKLVIARVGMKCFDLMTREGCKCPMCQVAFQPKTCGFVRCKWRYDGTYKSDAIHLAYMFATAPVSQQRQAQTIPYRSQHSYLLWHCRTCHVMRCIVESRSLMMLAPCWHAATSLHRFPARIVNAVGILPCARSQGRWHGHV
jgi:hypothetical protein